MSASHIPPRRMEGHGGWLAPSTHQDSGLTTRLNVTGQLSQPFLAQLRLKPLHALLERLQAQLRYLNPPHSFPGARERAQALTAGIQAHQ
jgi:hypothetical protein